MAWRSAALAFLAFTALAPMVQATPPADAFCVIVIEGLDGFAKVLVTVDLETNLTEREALFEELDSDGDGNVTPSESAVYRNDTMQGWETPRELGIKGIEAAAADGTWQWNADPQSALTWTQVGHTFHKQNHTQPATVGDPADLETQEIREFTLWHQHEPTMVHIHGGQDLMAPPPETSTGTTTATSTTGGSSTSSTPVPEYVVVRAPAGWMVVDVTGSDYEGRQTWNAGTAELDLPAFDTKAPFLIRFAKLPPNPPDEGPTDPPTVDPTGPDTASESARDRPQDDRPMPVPLGLAFAAVATAFVAAARRRLP